MILRSSPWSLWRVALDAALMNACCVSAIFIRLGGHGSEVLFAGRGWIKVLLVTATVQTAFYVFDLYDPDRMRTRAVIVLGILQAMGTASMALAIVFYSAPQMMLGRGVLLISLLLTMLVMVYWRLSVPLSLPCLFLQLAFGMLAGSIV